MAFFKKVKKLASGENKSKKVSPPPAAERVLTAEGWKRRTLTPTKTVK